MEDGRTAGLSCSYQHKDRTGSRTEPLEEVRPFQMAQKVICWSYRSSSNVTVILRNLGRQAIYWQRRYWIDQTRSDLGSGLVDPTGPDRLADLVDPDQYQIDLVGTGH
jgi:hypothetical protein